MMFSPLSGVGVGTAGIGGASDSASVNPISHADAFHNTVAALSLSGAKKKQAAQNNSAAKPDVQGRQPPVASRFGDIDWTFLANPFSLQLHSAKPSGGNSSVFNSLFGEFNSLQGNNVGKYAHMQSLAALFHTANSASKQPITAG